MARTVFLDFEASSLGKHSWPVEVGWVFEDGESESHLIRPAEAWTDWSERAERIHGISRATLAAEGTAHGVVAARMLAQLEGCRLYATAPSWDGKWLSVLLRGAGLPRHALRLEDTTLAHRRVVREVIAAADVPAAEADVLARSVLEEAQRLATPDARPAHRALADAQHELEVWRAIRELARQAVARR